jgi:hypothetical protein
VSAAGRSKSDQELDELYREPPAAFVAARNQHVKQFRAAGDSEEAERVKKLRRPSAAAWVLNRAALESPAEVEAFAEASAALERAQVRALEGAEGAAEEWRAAAAREREAADAAVDRASKLARDAGQPASDRVLELVAETLRAASADERLRDRVLRGRVEREQSAATLGTLAAAPSRKRKPAAKAAKRRQTTEARREVERLERELDNATAREERLRRQVELTAETLKRERAKLGESKREAAALRRRLRTAQRRSKD